VPTLPALQTRRSPTPDRAADQLVRALSELGIELALGIPGGAVGPLYDALLDAPGVQLVQTRHEASAVFAAGAYGRQTGRPALVLTTSGPGVLNTVNALAAASRDGLPLILIAGEVPRRHQGRRALQDGSAHDLDIAGTLRALVKQVQPVVEAAHLLPSLHEAVRVATTPPFGPVVLTVPADVLRARLPTTRIARAAPPQPPLPDVSEVTPLFSPESRVVILAGSGCRMGAGPRALAALAERLAAPVLTTPKAKAVFPESHPLARGIFGVGGHPSARETLEDGTDVVLVLGSSLGELATAGWDPVLHAGTHLIQVDVHGPALGRTLPVTHAIRASVQTFVAALLPHLPPAPQERPPGRLRRMPRGPGRCPDRMHPVDAVRELQHALPPNTVFAVDSGEHTFAALQHLVIDQPDAWFAMLGLGSMGSGICGALGLALAHPERPVACICGDGGLLMSLGELATAAADGLPVRWMVFNDQRLGMVAHGQQAIFGRSHDFDTAPGDLAAVARALGVTAFTVRQPGELMELSEVLHSHDGPVLVDIHIDPEPSMPKGGRLSTLADQAQEDA